MNRARKRVNMLKSLMVGVLSKISTDYLIWQHGHAEPHFQLTLVYKNRSKMSTLLTWTHFLVLRLCVCVCVSLVAK